MTEYIRTKVSAKPEIRYVKYSELKPGDTVVLGTYLGSRMVPNYNKDGEVPLHEFDTEDGKVALNSASDLDRTMNCLDEGQIVDITFIGQEKIKNKKGQYYKLNKFDVALLQEVE